MAEPDRRKTRPTSTILRSTELHGAHDPEVDGKEDADGNQDDLGGLEDAEPQDEQRHPGDRGDGTQPLQTGIEQAVAERRIAGDGAGKRTQHDAAGKAGEDAQQGHGGVALQFAGGGEVGKGRKDHRGRRHQAAARRPVRTKISQPTASATGTSSPKAGRRRRAAPTRRRARCGLTNPSELNISTVDIVQGRVTGKRQTLRPKATERAARSPFSVNWRQLLAVMK